MADGNGSKPVVVDDGPAPPEPQGPICSWPSWQSKVQKIVKKKWDADAPTMDGESSPHTSFTLRGLVN